MGGEVSKAEREWVKVEPCLNVRCFQHMGLISTHSACRSLSAPHWTIYAAESNYTSVFPRLDCELPYDCGEIYVKIGNSFSTADHVSCTPF